MLDDLSTSLRERVFFAARDGMSLTLYALLYEKSTDEIDDLLNSVSSHIVLLSQETWCMSLKRARFVIIFANVIHLISHETVTIMVYFYHTNQTVRYLLRVVYERVSCLIIFMRR